MRNADARYSQRAWGGPLDPPVGTDRDVSVLASTTTPIQRDLFPPRFGYNRDALGIAQVLDVDNYYKIPTDSFFSGGPASYTGSSTPSTSNALGNL